MPRATTMAAIADRDAANKYGIVLALLGLTYITSATAEGSGATTLVMLVQLVTLFLTFSASESPRARRLAGIACIVVGLLIMATWVTGMALSLDRTALKVLSIVSVLLYLVAPAVILRHLLRRTTVDGRTILGGICIYFMLGMMFAFSYRTVSLWQTSPPFFGDGGVGDNANFLFFSFITLTTTGYGNLVPATNPGQSLAVLEAIIGQLFLVTALAKIVNAWHVPGLSNPPKPAPDE
ncbi:MAG: potassium channel family protein [Candidatus Nanopelagicales bacterium]|nr:potassium channel family protein [Candidatus Nanopelagicales bacterium]MCU0296472.1 potassium channel family protein [Candidatus Nanopelagicales bacterium]MCU0299127.1 potassium channel family protein [Candidatus Nanopelagicales bacterium]